MLDAFLTGTAGPGDRWVIDDLGGRLAGVAYYAPERMTEGTWNLYLLAVAPTAQGAGRGAALVRHVEADLVVAEARVLLIETSGLDSFGVQRRFYRSLGFTEEARIRDFYAAGDDKVIFWKSLQSSP
jgi:ribosomal protein S18 acetylase RimI-like enzyme